MKNGPPFAALVLVSAGALTYEILLTRLFSIIQWHHFAYMIISLAMLGYGICGALLTLLREHLLPRYEIAFTLCVASFSISTIGAFLLAQRLPFNPLALYWDAWQPFYLLLLYLLLSVPLVFSAGCVGLSFIRYGSASHRIYSFDLFGAGGGSLLVVLLLFLLPPIGVLRAVGLLGLIGVALAVWHFNLRQHLMLPLLALIALIITTILPPTWTQLRMSSGKGLSQALLMPGASVVEERSSPLGLLTVVESPHIPFRHAPGLSLNAVQEPPSQLGIFTDGDGLAALTRFDGRLAPLAYLDQTTAALPYHLQQQPHVLLLGAGGGSGVLQALIHHARQVEVVDIDARMVDLLGNRFANFSGDLYRRPGVTIHVAEARSFVEASTTRYDLIQIELMDTFDAATSGLYGLSENYLYTVEGFQSYLRHLKPGGILALTRWVTLPPRDLLKLAATAIVAQEREGVSLPGQHLVLIRGWQTGTLLVKNGAFTSSEIAEIRAFSEARSFDVEWLPGLMREESNHYNVLDLPYFYDGIHALAGQHKQDFIERYKFDIRPATDDRPYFSHFFRWQALPEIFHLRARGGLSLLEFGYPILLATLLQAVLASVLLILLPLWLGLNGKKSGVRVASSKLATFSYFTLIGFAFIFIEITFIQKFTLYIGHPIYAMAGVLSTMLLFAGLGSRSAPHMLGWLNKKNFTPIYFLVAGIAILVLLNFLVSMLLMQFGGGLPALLRIVIVIAIIAPLAFMMGMPFPLGMARLDVETPAMLPWAWGVNACATVVGAALSALLSLHFGFIAVAMIAIVLYLAAALLFHSMAGNRLATG